MSGRSSTIKTNASADVQINGQGGWAAPIPVEAKTGVLDCSAECCWHSAERKGVVECDQKTGALDCSEECCRHSKK